MLPDSATLTLFVTAAFIMLITPGPAVTYIIALSLERGRTLGLLSVLGIQTATLCHVLGAALGLSGLLLSSALAFNAVKYAGAAYLIYLGIRKFLQRDDTATQSLFHGKTRWHIYREGFLVCILNPKPALFFFAFLPQFVDVRRGHVTLQILTLGLIFFFMAMVTDGMYALAAGTAGQWLRHHRGFMRAQRYISGGMYIGLGLFTALADVRRSK